MPVEPYLVRAAAKVPRPVTAAGSFWSVASSVVDQEPGPDDGLIGLLLDAAGHARSVRLPDLESRSTPEYAAYVRCWPGEHYRLLTGLVRAARPRVVVEIGTYLGHSALALLAGNPDVRVVTFDVISWRDQPGTLLTEADFADGRLVQVIADVSDPDERDRHLATLRDADLMFVDGPKDGLFEQRFAAHVLPSLTDRRRVVLFDDIRMLCMVRLWRSLPYPKLDATSLGHWSGTGMLATA